MTNQNNGEALVDTGATTATEIVKQKRGTVTRDPESTALVHILKLLDGLDEIAQARVVQYINDKYESAS